MNLFRGKLISVLIASLLASSLLSCSYTKTPDRESDAEKSKEEAMSTPAPSPAVTQASDQKDQPAANSLVNKFSKKDFERVDGSTATIPLSEAAAGKLLNLKPEEAVKVIRHYTTHNAYMRLIDKSVDIILVTEPSKEELELAKKNNIELEVVPVVKDAFVFLVNKKSSIESLTMKQLQDIYSGKLTDWSQAGGAKGPILAYQRPVNSGSQTLMLSKVMKGIPMVTPEKHMEPAGMGDLIEVIAGYDNSEAALGYSVYYYANTMYIRDSVKLIGVDGVKPEPATIKSDKYPLTSAYYAVLRKTEPEGSFAREFLKWLLSEEGQKTAEEIGYIALK